MKNFITSDLDQVTAIVFQKVPIKEQYRDETGKVVFEFAFEPAQQALSAYYANKIVGSLFDFQNTIKNLKKLFRNG